MIITKVRIPVEQHGFIAEAGDQRVQVAFLEIVFHDHDFDQLTVAGQVAGGDEDEWSVRNYDDLTSVPDWAKPWTIYLSWEA